MLVYQRCVICAGIMFMALFICYYQRLVIWRRIYVRFNITNMPSIPKCQTKNILLWNGYDRVEMDILLRGFQNYSCSFTNCWVTSDRKYLESLNKFDAIIFNMAVLHQLKTNKLPSPSERSFEQYYIFFTQESPFYHSENLKDYNGYFNWTMSYLPNSDILYPYGKAEASASLHVAVNYEINDKKRKLVAWFVSHCSTQSQREKYVKELQKYIQIDIYGLCGPLKCGWNEKTGNSQPECYKALQNNYKFYLSLENSLCKGYVTEKLYSILKLDVVPVVMGNAINYSVIAPPYSYIDALQYSPKELADYLILLDSNDTLYNRYFEWKSHYIIYSDYEEIGKEALCSLCGKLNMEPDRNKTPADLLSTWNPRTRCLNPRYLKAFHGIDLTTM